MVRATGDSKPWGHLVCRELVQQHPGPRRSLMDRVAFGYHGSPGIRPSPGAVKTPRDSEKGLHLTQKSTDWPGENTYIARTSRANVHPWLDGNVQAQDAGIKPAWPWHNGLRL